MEVILLMGAQRIKIRGEDARANSWINIDAN